MVSPIMKSDIVKRPLPPRCVTMDDSTALARHIVDGPHHGKGVRRRDTVSLGYVCLISSICFHLYLIILLRLYVIQKLTSNAIYSPVCKI